MTSSHKEHVESVSCCLLDMAQPASRYMFTTQQVWVIRDPTSQAAKGARRSTCSHYYYCSAGAAAFWALNVKYSQTRKSGVTGLADQIAAHVDIHLQQMARRAKAGVIALLASVIGCSPERCSTSKAPPDRKTRAGDELLLDLEEALGSRRNGFGPLFGWRLGLGQDDSDLAFHGARREQGNDASPKGPEYVAAIQQQLPPCFKVYGRSRT